MLKHAIIAGCLVLSAAGIAWGAEDSFGLPADMQKLLPAEPAFIVAVTSVHDLERQWQAIEEMFSDERTDLVRLFSEQIPRFTEFADMDRPLAFVMGLPNLMGGGKPGFTFIVPLVDNSRPPEEMVTDTKGTTLLKEGDYLAISTDPLFVPATETPDLALGLSPGFISTRLDLEMVIDAYGPLVQMGLGAMGNAPALPDSQSIGEGAHPGQMSPGEIAAMQELARSIMDSAKHFDLSLGIEGDELTLHSGLSVHPDSPLDPGPQPSFENALQLTRMLPEGGNILQTMALDQTRQFEVFRSFYSAGIEKTTADMPPEQGAAYRAWVESYLDSFDLLANPLAASISMAADGMSTNMVMECTDAPASLERFAALFEGLSDADIGIKMKKMPTGKVAGVDVRSWTVDYDPEKLAALSSNSLNPRLGGAGRMQAEQMIAILRKVAPDINMAAKGDYLILSADPDPSNLAHMIQAAGQRRGAAHPETAVVAAKAGSACQQVVVGDLMSVLAWITELMEEMNAEEYAVVKGNPIPFSAATTIGESDYGLDWTMDMPAVKRFVKVIAQMEAMNHLHDDDGDDDGDGDDDQAEETD